MSPLTQGAIEDRIHEIAVRLEAETEKYGALSETAAEAEADYKALVNRHRIVLANEMTTRKMTAAEREARIEHDAAESFRSWKLYEARRQATRESLLSLRALLDALRTLSANVRAQT